MARKEQPEGRNAAEWVTLAVSAVIVAAFVALALYEQFERNGPEGALISLEIGVEGAEQRGELYYVPFTVSNDGAAPAEDVTIDFTISSGDQVVQETSVLIPFLAANDSADGELVTAQDPATHTIEGQPSTLIVP
jgi:uncharacterized protein (TIGR02588 family)